MDRFERLGPISNQAHARARPCLSVGAREKQMDNEQELRGGRNGWDRKAGKGREAEE